ncbi:MAG: carboxypeptidase regulatory-like domain-containing protein [Bacteroidia bacterium]|nr:carboxypeptidase regulatory-like domain-containing protein [Bacteroidia bacterium]
MRIAALRLALAGGLLLCALHAAAQVTTAAISGTVTSQQGEPLEGVAVTALHQPSGVRYGTTTRAGGAYDLPGLRVGGPYRLEFRYTSAAPEVREGISLRLGQKLLLDVRLNDLTIDEVVITDGAINPDRTGAQYNFGSDKLSNLPTISRSASDITRLTPGADGNSFVGRNDQFNNFTVDGAIFTNPFGLDAATPGGQTDAQPISLDAFEQISVSVAPFDVTQAGFTGAAVNAVTKSGTNTLSGTVFGYFRNQDLTGGKINGQSIVVPDLTQYQTGFAIGGPIIRNRAFFFVNAELDQREDLGTTFVALEPGRIGENVSRVEAADLQAVSNALFQRYEYETGPYEGYLHSTNSLKGIAKLDLVLGKSHTLTATYNFLDAYKDKPAHPSAIGRRGPDLTTLQFRNSGYRINNGINSGIVELRSVFGNRASNKLQAGVTAFNDSRDAFSDPFPVVNINKEGIRYIVAGHEPFSINNRLGQRVYQFTDNFTLYAGKHTLTAGTSFERFEFDNSFNLNAYGGTFGPGFESVAAFLDSVNSGAFDDDVAAARQTYLNNGGDDGEGWALAETNVGQWAVYLQDEIRLSPQFSLTGGLRMDLPLYFNTAEKIQENIDRNCCYIEDIEWSDENGDPVTFVHTELPRQRPLISPRVGFNYDLTGDQRAQLRGGTGFFAGRLPFVWIGNQVANPNFFFYNYTRRDFRFPQVWRTNLGYDQKLGSNWTVTADVLFTRDLQAAMVRNYGLRLPSGTLQGPDSRPIYTAADRVQVFGAATNAYVFTNVNQGYSFNFSLQVQRSFPDGFASLGYNFLDAQDISSIEAEISSDAYDRNPISGNANLPLLAPSLYGTRHRIFGSGYKTFRYGKWATTVSTFFQIAQGGTTQNDNVGDFRFSYTYSGDLNNDGSALNDLIFIPTDAQLDQMNFVNAEQREAFRDFIEQDAYLSANRGRIAEKYAVLAPWYSQWDLSVKQDLMLQAGERTHKIQASLDILGFGNLLNSSWGVKQLPVNTQPVGVTVDGNGVPTYSFDPSLTSSFAADFSLASRWQARIGLRYSF